jgi:hypothetical protein
LFSGTLNPKHEPTMQAHPHPPLDARPAAALAEAGVGSSCAVMSRGRGIAGFGIGRRISGFGGQSWKRGDRYKQRGRSVARA